MNFVRIGRRIVNLDYAVVTEGREPGCLRMYLASGRVVDLDEQETADLRAELDRLVPPADEPGQGPATESWRGRPPLLWAPPPPPPPLPPRPPPPGGSAPPFPAGVPA